MGKLEQFKLRASEHGQSVVIYPFSAYPAGTYVDANSGYPDPESATYPGTVPGTTYATAVTLQAFVQMGTQGKTYKKQPQGEELPIDAMAYVPGDQVVTVRDKVVIGGENYEVMRIAEHQDGSTMIVKDCYLRKMTP